MKQLLEKPYVQLLLIEFIFILIAASLFGSFVKALEVAFAITFIFFLPALTITAVFHRNLVETFLLANLLCLCYPLLYLPLNAWFRIPLSLPVLLIAPILLLTVGIWLHKQPQPNQPRNKTK